MSSTAGTGGPVGAPLGRRPARAAGLELLGEVAGSGYRRAPSLARRADGQMVQLTPLLFQLLDLIDGERDDEALASALGERSGKLVTAGDVRFLIEHHLRPLGLLELPDGGQPAVKKMNPLLALRLKLVLSNPAATRLVSAPFAPFFRPAVVVPMVVAFMLTTWWVGYHHGLAPAARQAIYQPEMLLLVFGLTWVSAGFHELGHAAACRYGGARPGAMGVGLYLIWPAFYTDVTDSYRLGRGGRLRVDLGGLYFNMIFGVGVYLVWTLLHTDALLLVIAAQLLQMIRQLVPFVRFDGYHILADLTGVPDLFLHIKPTLLGLVRRRRAHGTALKPWARAVVTAWVLAVVPLLAMIFVGMVLVMPRIAATAWDSLGIRAAELATGWHDGDPAAVASTLLRMLLICLPIAGMIYMAARIGRRTVRSTWRRTAERPLMRAGAALVAVALLGGLAWAWQPSDRYTPIQAKEVWRLGAFPQLPVQRLPQVRPASARVTPPPPAPPSGGAPAPAPTHAPAPAPAGHYEWRPVLVKQSTPSPPQAGDTTTSRVTVVVPSEPLPPKTEPAGPSPAAAPSDVPATGDAATTTRSEWPFPWDRPRQPVEGDNQVASINTRDGSTEYHTALALLWVRNGDDVKERNEAYAEASCNDCHTGAVAFQVILIVGYSGVITPVNSAVSANYDCKRCSTQAVAVQLVATLNREPDAATKAELDRIMADLQAKSITFQGQSADQVYATLMAAQQEILRLLGAGGSSSGETTTDTTNGTATTTAPAATTPATITPTTTAPAPSETTPTETSPADTTATETTATETTQTETTQTETTPPPTDTAPADTTTDQTTTGPSGPTDP